MSPDEYYAHAMRSADAEGRLGLSQMTGWEVCPFEPDGLRVVPLAAPVLPEPARAGEGGRICPACIAARGTSDGKAPGGVTADDGVADDGAAADGAAGSRTPGGRALPPGTIWSDEHWRIKAYGPSGAPLILILETHEHYDLATLPDDRARELGLLVVHLARAIESLPHIARAHVSRWGDGGAHLHVFFFARPAGFAQLRGTFLAVWDDLLPPVPAGQFGADAATVARMLVSSYGGNAA